MDNSVRLWDKSNVPQNIRLPRTLSATNRGQEGQTSSSNVPETSSVLTSTPPVMSKLNVDAKEFVPQYFNLEQSPQLSSVPQTSRQSSIQNRLQKPRENVNSNQQASKFGLVNSYEDSKAVFTENSLDDKRLCQLINTLTNDPGQYDNLLEIFIETLVPYLSDVLATTHVTELIVKQAINYQSFRYTGAKLCCYIEEDFPVFRAQLHISCKNELRTNANKQGVLLFIAELYTQLHYENIYGQCLTDAFKELLCSGGADNIKSICQALKLTGYSLEKYDRKVMDDIFRQLEGCKSTVSGTPLSLIESVIGLRYAHWGHAREGFENQNSSEYLEPEGEYWSEGLSEEGEGATLFYNTDGNMLTSEETEFLASNLQSTDEYLLYHSDPDDLSDPEPEMDEEIRAAFKEFVKMSKR